MNWIAQAFEALKAKTEAHITHANASLTDVAARVDSVELDVKNGLDGAVKYVRSAVSSVESKVSSAESRIATLETVTVQGLLNRVQALEMRLSEELKARAS